MSAEIDHKTQFRRVWLAVIGLAAGVCAYAILDLLPEVIGNGRLLLAVSSFGIVIFGSGLAMTGPLPPLRAAAGAGLVACGVAALMTWASLRFDAVGPFLETGHPILAGAVITVVFLPFWIAASRPDATWRDYEALFDEAWRIVVRMLVAAVFTGIVWAVIGLSDAFLGVVGIDVIGDLLEVDIVPFAVTGLVFGLGLAVVHEFADRVTPYLALRLLRLILPVVVVVTAVFLAVLPFRGLSDLFGNLSAAGILMSVAVTGIALVSIAVDRRDAIAVQPGMLRISARVMAVFLPVLGGLAVWAIGLRVGQYGWSPDRVAAMTAALLCLSYGIAYALAALSGRDWMRRLRGLNIALALGVAATGILWLTPVIDPQRISAASQVSRFEAGRVDADALDLWSMRDDWGRAGARALARMAALEHPDAEALTARIAALDDAPNRRVFETALPPAALNDLADALADRLLVRPAGAALPEGILRDVPVLQLQLWRDACERTTPGGTRGCVAVIADFLPDEPGEEVLVLTLSGGGYVQFAALVPARRGRADEPTGIVAAGAVAGDLAALSRPETLDRIAGTASEFVPLPLNSLRLGNERLFILP